MTPGDGLRSARPRGHVEAGRAWRAQTTRHRALVGEPCPRCGALAVELDLDGYACRGCGWRPSVTITRKGSAMDELDALTDAAVAEARAARRARERRGD